MVRTTRGDGRTTFGSGYLIAPAIVLTAWHVIDRAQEPVEVRLPAAGSEYRAEPLWLDQEVDVALLSLKAPAIVGLPVSPMRALAQLGADEASGVILGFPRYARQRKAQSGGSDLVELQLTRKLAQHGLSVRKLSPAANEVRPTGGS